MSHKKNDNCGYKNSSWRSQGVLRAGDKWEVVYSMKVILNN